VTFDELRPVGAHEAGPAFSDGACDLLRRNVLEFVCDPVSSRVLTGERTDYALLEQTILDEAGRQIGRVSEDPPYRRRTGRFVVPREFGWPAGVYDHNNNRVVRFFVSDNFAYCAGEFQKSGRRLEVRNCAREVVGTLVTKEWGGRGSFLDNSDWCIGAIRTVRSSSDDCSIVGPRGGEIGWIATPRRHAKRLAARGLPVPESSVKGRWFRAKPEEGGRYFLVIRSEVNLRLRLMLLATAASMHLNVVVPSSEVPD
jgi:hypothetical protein